MKEVYLSGASKHIEDNGSTWRNEASNYLKDCGWNCFNPNKHYDYKELMPETDKACLKLFINRLKKCDVVLVNLNDTNSSCGTAFELGYSMAIGLPIIAFGNYNSYNWCGEVADVVFDSLEDAISYIVIHY